MNLSKMPPINLVELGLIEYKKALQIQLNLVDRVKKTGQEFLIICSHPRVLTVGSSACENEIKNFDGEIVKVKRGGKATLHGPGQIILYPILNLNKRNRQLHLHLRKLEEIVITTLKALGFHSYAENTGIWINDKKIASIGIGAKKWVTYHGLAFNFNNDFCNCEFKPCGYNLSDMTCFVHTAKKNVFF